jgi:hypothetical protein
VLPLLYTEAAGEQVGGERRRTTDDRRRTAAGNLQPVPPANLRVTTWVYDATREAGIDRVPTSVRGRLSHERSPEPVRETPLCLGSSPNLYLDGEPKADLLQFPVRGQPTRVFA